MYFLHAHIAKRSIVLLWIALLGFAILSIGTAPTVHAATFNIADGDVSGLIAAINTANGDGVPDTIELATNGTYELTAVDNNTNGPNGLPSIISDLTINANGSTISRSSASGTPVFRILHVSVAGNLTLNLATISSGHGSIVAGGIYNFGLINITESSISNNVGTGIYNESSGSANIIGSLISGNVDGDGVAGGGINNAVLIITKAY